MQAMVMFDISFLSKLHVVCMRLCNTTGEGVEQAQPVMSLVEHETVIKIDAKYTDLSLILMLSNDMRGTWGSLVFKALRY